MAGLHCGASGGIASSAQCERARLARARHTLSSPPSYGEISHALVDEIRRHDSALSEGRGRRGTQASRDGVNRWFSLQSCRKQVLCYLTAHGALLRSCSDGKDTAQLLQLRTVQRVSGQIAGPQPLLHLGCTNTPYIKPLYTTC